MASKKRSIEIAQSSDANVEKKEAAKAKHNRIEKRRKLKIKNELNVLQQLVPSANNYTQYDTLHSATRYIKDLQVKIHTLESKIASLHFQLAHQNNCFKNSVFHSPTDCSLPNNLNQPMDYSQFVRQYPHYFSSVTNVRPLDNYPYYYTNGTNGMH